MQKVEFAWHGKKKLGAQGVLIVVRTHSLMPSDSLCAFSWGMFSLAEKLSLLSEKECIEQVHAGHIPDLDCVW